MTNTTLDPVDASAVPARLAAGATAGVAAGVAFLIASMIYGAVAGPTAWAPPRMIATIVGFSMDPAFAAGPVLVGLLVHLGISAMYGAGYALVAGGLRGAPSLIAGTAFGAALYVVNFEVIAHLDHFAVFRMMAGNWFEILVHLAFGAMTAALLLRSAARGA